MEVVEVIKLLGAVLVPVALFVLKDLRSDIKSLKMELRDYVTEKQCEAHRAMLQAQIDNLKNK